MQATRPRQGVTWFQPLHRALTHGVTWCLAAFLAVAVLATSVVPAAESPDAVAADVGVLGTSSMIEMLGSETSGKAVTLTELRQIVLQNPSVVGDGTGIDVAVIDTGVAPVPGLSGDKVLHGPDLSFEGASPQAAYIDTYGHGTHMAGIIAGNRNGHNGVAPGARIVSVKVAGHDGLTTIPQVVAAIDWVVEHKNSNGMNIRVLNLSLGQAGVDNHVGDLLSAAVERAWDAGIFVVVAAGNRGETQTHLDSPAIDPFILAVGAADSMSSTNRKQQDVPDWSAVGNNVRNPDVVASGRSILSYRVPGSTVDNLAPGARAGDLFRGSGTSQSAAAVSGAAAAILSARPSLDNDSLKKALMVQAEGLDNEPTTRAGQGLIDAGAVLGVTDRIMKLRTVRSVSLAPVSTTMVYTGETDAALAPALTTVSAVDLTPQRNKVPAGNRWSGGTWSGGTWSGATWSGATWSGGTWSGATWSGATWSGATWSGATWSGGTWSGATWSGATWSGATWSGATWSGKGWVD